MTALLSSQHTGMARESICGWSGIHASISRVVCIYTSVEDAAKNGDSAEPEPVQDREFNEEFSLDFERTKCREDRPVVVETLDALKQTLIFQW